MASTIPSGARPKLWSTIGLYFRLIGAKIRAQMQYKLSFCFDLIGFTLSSGLEFVVIAILLNRFGAIAGWNIAELALLYGMTSIAFGLAEMLGRGFDAPFEKLIQEGSFDTLLIRPHGSFFLVLASECQLRRLGRIIQSIAVLSYALPNLSIAWTAANLTLIPLTILSGTLIYLGLMVIGATLCFWTIKTPEVINIFTFGGQEMLSYPLSIYSRWMRGLFLSIIPLGFVNYPAALWLLSRTDPYGMPSCLAWAAPIVGMLFLRGALLFWQIGVSKYQSTGS
ncbi:MAG: ABC-2 family transporter protein [Chloroflexales bacterium]|nr:ABC-2 family transporter protein [Chloroflexales bacterium]